MDKLRKFWRKNSAKFMVGVLYSAFIVVAGVGIYYYLNVYKNYDKYETNNLALKLGARGKLNCFGKSLNPKVEETVWITSDPSIIDVDSNGFVIANKVGKVDITQITRDGNMAICKVQVRKNLNTDIAYEDEDTNIDSGLPNVKNGPVVLNKTEEDEDFIILDDLEGYEEEMDDFDIEDFDPDESYLIEDEDGITVDDDDNIIISDPDDFDIKDDEGSGELIGEDNNGNTLADIFTPEGQIKKIVEKVTLNVKDLKVFLGNTYKINALVSPDEAGEKNLSYTSSDETVAKISSDGVVSAIKTGEVEITVKSSNAKEAKCKVQVLPKEDVDTSSPEDDVDLDEEGEDFDEEEVLESDNVTTNTVKFDYTTLNLNIGNKVTPSIKYTTKTTPVYTYTSSNPAVVSVVNGIIVAKSLGSATITVTTESGLTASTTVKVNALSPTSVKFSKSDITLPIGSAYELLYVFNNSILGDMAVTDRNVTIKSDNSSVVGINGNKVTGLKKGSSTVTITTANGKTDTCKVTINEVEASAVNISVSSLSLKQGENKTISATVIPTTATKKALKWSSSNTKVATVNNGNVIAIAPGSATITATAENGVKASIPVTVGSKDVAVSSVSVKLDGKEKTILKKGKSQNLSVSVTPSNATNKNVSYSSSNTAVAKVDGSGKVTGVNYGSATITASAGGKKDKVKVIVTPNKNLVKVSGTKYKDIRTYKVYHSGTSSTGFSQNFDFVGDTLYVSFPKAATVSGKCTSKNTDTVTRVTVVKIPKKEVSNPSSKKRKYFTIIGSGHGQSFDMHDGYVWTVGDPIGTYKDGKCHGTGKKLIRIKFDAGKTKKWSDATQKVTIKYNNKTYTNPEISIDSSTDTIALKVGSRILVYTFSSFVKGEYNLLYTFTIPSGSSFFEKKALANGTLSADYVKKIVAGVNKPYASSKTYYRQGMAIHNGYYYQLYGNPGSEQLILVFDMMGNVVDKRLTASKKDSYYEPEGFKMISGTPYVGTMKKDNRNGHIYKLQ